MAASCFRAEPPGPLRQAEREQELALGDRAVDSDPRPRFFAQSGEIDVRGEVRFAGRVKRVGVAMAAHAPAACRRARSRRGRSR